MADGFVLDETFDCSLSPVVESLGVERFFNDTDSRVVLDDFGYVLQSKGLMRGPIL